MKDQKCLIVGFTAASMMALLLNFGSPNTAQAGPLLGAVGGAIGGGMVGRIFGGRRGARIGRVIGGFTGMVRGAANASRRYDYYNRSYYQPYPQYYEQPTYSTYSATPTNTPSSNASNSNEFIRSIQQSLIRLGFDPGPVDGQMGPKVRTAISEYQQSRGLLVTGDASPQLLQHMQTQN